MTGARASEATGPRTPGPNGEPPVELLTAAENLAADEAAFAGPVPAVRTAVLRERALSVGIGVPGDAPYLRRARESGIPVVRRPSGGAGVLHEPGDLAWSLVLSRRDPRAGRGFVHAYSSLGSGVVDFFRSLGCSAEWVPAPGLSDDVCFLSGRGEVLAVGGRIVGGAAQRVNRHHLLHHGVISATIDRAALGRVHPEASARTLDRLGSLAELGVRSDPVVAAQRLALALAATTGFR